MTRPSILNGARLSAILAVAVLAAAVAWALWFTARAPEQSERSADIRRLATLSPIEAKRDAQTGTYPPGAVCSSDLAAAEALLRIRLADAAAASGVELAKADLVQEPDEPLSAISIDARIEGSYASGLNFMKIIADMTPTVFVQQLDMNRAQPDQIVWTLSGRIYCAVRLGS